MKKLAMNLNYSEEDGPDHDTKMLWMTMIYHSNICYDQGAAGRGEVINEKKREIYRRNNHRNNDVYGVARATGRLSYVTDNTELARLIESDNGEYDEVITEDDIIGIIDGDFE